MSVIARVRTLGVLLLTCFASAVWGVEPAPPGKAVIVLQGFASECQQCGVLVLGLLALEERGRQREMARVYQELQAALPDVDIPRSLRGSFCKALFSDGSVDCDRVVIAGHADGSGTIPELQADSADIVVRIAIEFVRNEFRVIAAVGRPPIGGRASPTPLYAWYVTPPRSELKASPFDPITKKNESRVSAARNYWLDGESGVLKRELLQSFDDIAGIVSRSMAALDPDAARVRAWWEGLPKIGELRDAGRLNCPRYMCTVPYLNVTSERIWNVQLNRDVVIMSLSLSSPMFAK